MQIRMPWKVKRLFQQIVGDDYLYNKATFKPDFTFESFKHLLPESVAVLSGKPINKQQLVNCFLKSTAKNPLILSRSALLEHQTYLPNPLLKSELLAAVSQLSTEHYAVYHQLLSPMNGEFSWHGFKKGPNNDQLYMSRPQRFGFAPIIAQAALFEPQYISKLLTIFRTWQAYATSCKYRWPYNSSHALVYRVVALIMTWQFIAANAHSHDDKNDLLFETLNILKSDVAYLAPRLGHAHPNNHLLADYFVGWLINVTFPELIPSEYDFSQYELLWQKELLRQFYPDGGCFEHAVHYQEHGCEMALIYRLMCDDKKLPKEVNDRIKNMMFFQKRLNGLYDKPWKLGDTTEDTLLPLDTHMGWSSATISNAYQHFYGNEGASSRKVLDPKSFFLMPSIPDQESKINISVKYNVCHIFSDSGLVHWTDTDTQSEVLFRTGVVEGTLFMPGHMHADTLSIYWRIRGIDVLAASGTYSYKFAQTKGINLRDYFCGPNSHSRVVINNLDPLGKLAGDFRDHDNNLRVIQNSYGNESNTTLVESQLSVDNEYDGLLRCVIQMPPFNCLVIDKLTKAQLKQPVKINWYLDSAIKPKIVENEIQCFHNDKMLSRLFCAKTSSKKNPNISLIEGWQSEEYGCLKANQIVEVTFEQSKEIQATLLTQDHGIKACEIININDTNEFITIEITSDKQKELVHYSYLDKSVIIIDELTIEAKAIIHRILIDHTESIEVIECYSMVGNQEFMKLKANKFDLLFLKKPINSHEWVLT